MKALVIFYSYSGHAEKRAQELAAKESADTFEVKDQKKKPVKLKAYTAGCFAAMRMQSWPIEPVTADLTSYDKIIVVAPVWAGHPAPEINNVFGMLPPGKDVEVYMVSASGGSSAREKVQSLISRRDSRMLKYVDIKG